MSASLVGSEMCIRDRIPITKDGRLSAKEVVGNKKALTDH
ncbi:hypothetical protein JMUB7537_28320 [Staphylococcus aureus]